MKKKIPLFALLLIVCIFVIYATTVKRVYHKEVRIGYGLIQVSEKMISIKKVAQWYQPFAILDSGKNVFSKGAKHILTNSDHSIEIKESSPFDAFYKVTEGSNSRLFRFTIIPDSAHSCLVALKYESTLWSRIWGDDDLTLNAQKSLDNFKEYFSDTKKMYGFDPSK